MVFLIQDIVLIRWAFWWKFWVIEEIIKRIPKILISRDFQNSFWDNETAKLCENYNKCRRKNYRRESQVHCMAILTAASNKHYYTLLSMWFKSDKKAPLNIPNGYSSILSSLFLSIMNWALFSTKNTYGTFR